MANIRGHEGTEVWYDGKWHYFDCDVQMYHRLRSPNQHIIASRQQLYEDPTLVSDQPNPSNPYALPDHLPENMQPLYESEPTYTPLKEERIHSVDFVLRPGEEMTRLFRHRGRWIVYERYVPSFRRWRRETGWEGPTERFWPRRTWGNGILRYRPKLATGWRDVAVGAESLEGLAQTQAGLRASGDVGAATFAMASPYVFCGVPDPYRRTPSQHGSLIKLSLDLPQSGRARVEAAAGWSDQWQQIWQSDQAGGVTGEIDFTRLSEAQYRIRLRFVLEGAGATLKDLDIGMYFMCSPHSLPALRKVGANKMSFHCGDEYGLNSRGMLLEYKMVGGRSVPGAYATRNLKYAPTSYSKLLPADPASPWEVIYHVASPGGGKMAWLAAFTVIEGRKPDEPYDGHEATIEVAESPDGPWQTIGSSPILAHEHGWHFGLFGQHRLSGKTSAAYVRFSSKKGALGFRINGHYVPVNGGPPLGPLEIEHQWYELDPSVGRRLRSHVETVTSSEHEYVVNCAAEPHDDAVILRVPSVTG